MGYQLWIISWAMIFRGQKRSLPKTLERNGFDDVESSFIRLDDGLDDGLDDPKRPYFRLVNYHHPGLHAVGTSLQDSFLSDTVVNTELSRFFYLRFLTFQMGK